MYHKDDDRYESRRSSHHHRTRDEDDYDKSSKSRSRWDDRDRSGRDRDRRRDSSRDRDRDRRDYDGGRRTSDKHSRHSSSSSSKSRDRRSRSRSRSPNIKRERDYSDRSSRDAQTKKVSSSWSDSSGEDDGAERRMKYGEETDTHQSYSSRYGYDSGSADSTLGSHGSAAVATSDTYPYGGSKSSETSISSPTSSSNAAAGISLKLGGTGNVGKSSAPLPLPKVITATVQAKPVKVAAIFNTDSDDEPEEMPPECKMRMKNIGRETKTSEGPNSFGKTKIGFCNLSHLTEKRLESGASGKDFGKGPSKK